MTKEEMIKNVQTYYDSEITDLTRLKNQMIEEHSTLYKPKEVCHNSIQRCLGVAFFIQQAGLDFSTADKLYDETRYQLEELEKEWSVAFVKIEKRKRGK